VPTPGVSLGHGLQLEYLRLQKQNSNGGWTVASALSPNEKYRYKIGFDNISSPLADAYLDLTWIKIFEPTYTRFYADASYTGSPTNVGKTDGGRVYRNKRQYFYIYFIWESPIDAATPPPGVRLQVDLYSAVSKGVRSSTVVPLIS
jgi:hypothetical protein